MPLQYPKLTPKPTMVKSESPEDPKSKAHRRSRSGCFTCRLRRKKCDESKPCCRACKKLGVDCEYSLPSWWTSPDRRRKHRDNIKNIIKTTKTNEKQPKISSHNKPSSASSTTTPSLYHSAASSESRYGSYGPSRAPSLDSCYSAPFGVGGVDHSHDLHHPFMHPQAYWATDFSHFPAGSPYEVDVTTDREIFIDDVPLMKDSVTSTFTGYEPDTMELAINHLTQNELFEQHNEFATEEPLHFNIFDFAHEPLSPNHQTVVNVDDCDRYLLDHFLSHVAKLVFPMLEVNQPGSTWADVILPALENNKSFLHGSLSVAALHIKATEQVEGDDIDNDIMRHRIAAVAELCESFGAGADTSRILEATLAMIFFQSALGSPQDGLPDIAWHQHFQAATDFIQTLQLQTIESANAPTHMVPSFQMTLASWIDILGGTMLGKAPFFAQLYREKRELGISSGLSELMGCDDNIMYLIAEIACLEALRDQGYADDVEIMCAHITDIGRLLDFTEAGYGEVMSVFDETAGAGVDVTQLACNTTAVFRMAARLYLCSLIPDFERQSPNVVILLESFVNAMAFIPAGRDGFDRSLVWPLLMAGSVSVEGSSFRSMFAERVAMLGNGVEFGAFGRLKEILEDIWAINDVAVVAMAAGDVDAKIVHWRGAMKHRGWDFLLI